MNPCKFELKLKSSDIGMYIGTYVLSFLETGFVFGQRLGCV